MARTRSHRQRFDNHVCWSFNRGFPDASATVVRQEDGWAVMLGRVINEGANADGIRLTASVSKNTLGSVTPPL